jgi:PAS domain-containing protein
MSAADFPPGEAGAAERQTILDAIPAIAWCKSPNGSNEFVNQRWQEYTGIPAEEAPEHGWQKAVHPKTFRSWRVRSFRSTRIGRPSITRA